MGTTGFFASSTNARGRNSGYFFVQGLNFMARYFRSHLRMEQALRLELTGIYSNTEIARFLGIQVGTLIVLKARPEYQRKRAELLTGAIDTFVDMTRTQTETLLYEVRDLVPPALATLRNALVRGNRLDASRDERRMALDAAKEVMDREGTLAKVSKTSVTVKNEISFQEQESIETDLLAMMQKAQEQGSQEKILDSFVSAGGDLEVQNKMKQTIKLEDFNSSTVQ